MACSLALNLMGESKDEPRFHHTVVVEDLQQPDLNSGEKDERKKEKRKRLDSLDVFRGLTVVLMILVDDAGGEWPVIAHAPWNGCNLADFVMPFFLFIVGMAIPLALKVRLTNWRIALRKVVFRTLKLLFWGILLQGGYSHAPDDLSYGVNMKRVRWCGILQRIALAYLIVSGLEVANKNARGKSHPLGHLSVFKLYFCQWVAGLGVLVIYLSVLYGTYVPDWEFTVVDKTKPDYGKHFIIACGVRGSLDPPCNAVGYVDRKACTANSPFEGPLLNNAPSWCHAPFEPEGILSSISAILSTVIGSHFGHVIIHIKDHTRRLKHWSLMGLTCFVLGMILHFTNAIPFNKQLYSFSYVCVTSGTAALVFSALYILVDVVGFKYPFLPLKWIGMNAMLVYVMAAEGIFAGFFNGWYYEDPHNTLVHWIQKHIFIKVWHSRRVGILLYVIFGEILFWAVFFTGCAFTGSFKKSSRNVCFVCNGSMGDGDQRLGFEEPFHLPFSSICDEIPSHMTERHFQHNLEHILENHPQVSMAAQKRKGLDSLDIFRGLSILIIHLSVVYGTYVPDWEFTVVDKSGSDYGKHFKVVYGVRGNSDPPCNAIGYFDRIILGINHLYRHPAWRRLKACTANATYTGPILDNAPSWCHAPLEPEGVVNFSFYKHLEIGIHSLERVLVGLILIFAV
ncbi:hypothetical protein V2J09_007861 [Rumex salicifolius]